MWALSKLAAPGERDEALLDAVAGAMLPALPDFNAQNVANTVCAVITGFSHTFPCRTVCAHISAYARSHVFAPWYCPHVRRQHMTHCMTSTRQVPALILIRFCLPQMWAYATFGYKPTPESLVDELEAAALRILPTFSCQNISNTMWCVRAVAFLRPA